MLNWIKMRRLWRKMKHRLRTNEQQPQLHEVPKICSLHVQSNIRYRYAHTVVCSEVLNSADTGQEVTFSITLPETAFISSFSIQVDGKTYDAKVKEKEEAKQEYAKAVKQGRTAAHVAVNPRESNRFSVSVNVEAQKKIKFTLTYEELLNRKLGTYKHFINLEPGQIVDDFSVQVNIEESTDITTLSVPPLKRCGDSELPPSSDEKDDNTLVTILRPSPHSAIVKYEPTPDQQRKLSKDGVNGQMVVVYDVDRSSFPSQILVNDGYFAHFFAPDQLKPMPKYVTFVLDISGSMSGRKINQLKEAMESILSELHPQDYFTLLVFNTSVEIWRLIGDGEFSTASIQETDWKKLLVPATIDNILRAKLAIHKLRAGGGTDIYTAFMSATHIVQLRLALQQAKSIVLEPLIIFLTDGQPTVGQCGVDEIINETTRWNQMGKAAIFSLGLGTDVNFDFLKKLSLRNSGFARKIYEASDTALQLSNFYKEVSSPLLSNITFIYQPEQVDSTSVTRNHFVTFFHGSELIICGRVDPRISERAFQFSVTGNCSEGTRQFEPEEARIELVQKAGFMERLWGYLTIQQLLEEESKLDGQQAAEKKHQATQLALKFSFVTPVTSLVVVRPDDDQKPRKEVMHVDLSDYDTLDDYIDNSMPLFPGNPASQRHCRMQIMESRSCHLMSSCSFSKKKVKRIFPEPLSRIAFLSEQEDYQSLQVVPAPEVKRIFLCNFFTWMESENAYKCTICMEKITENSTQNMRSHVLTSHPEESKCSLLDFDICHPDDAVVLQQVAAAINNENISLHLKGEIENEAREIAYKIQDKLENSTLHLKLDITMKQSHFFLIISIESILSQNKDAKILDMIQIPRDSTPETLENIVRSTLTQYSIVICNILLFITDCVYDTTESYSTEDLEEFQNTALKLIKGVESIGISGGWSPKKILNQSVGDFLKSQPIITKLGKSIEELKIPTVSVNKELNIGMKDWQLAYNILNNLVESKGTSNLGITEEDWQQIAQTGEVLKPLKSAMETFEEKQHTFIELYGTWMDCAQDTRKIQTPSAEALSTCMHKKTNECPLFTAMLFLDPRHKSSLDEHQLYLAKEQIIKVWQFITSSLGITAAVGTKELQQLFEGYNNSVQEATKQSALQYWESQKDLQPIMYKIASSVLSVTLLKSSPDKFLCNANIMLSSLPDDVKQNIVRIRCFKMFGDAEL